MKEQGWSLDTAYQYVKEKRSCIKPNAGFMQQLTTYQGILDARWFCINMLIMPIRIPCGVSMHSAYT